MGAVVGRCLAGTGHPVLWASDGRGQETAARAKAAGLTDVSAVAAAAGQADVVLSICPPHAAADVARSVRGFAGLYIDANAISPRTASDVAAIVTSGGATYVDGGLIGPPPAQQGTTRLYLSGDQAAAAAAAALFENTPLDVRVVAAGPFSASAVKMAFAAWTKGSIALLLASRALAEAEGISEELLAEWAISQPALADRLRYGTQSTAAKGWRWIAEMEEIAATMTAAGLPDGFHQAAADLYRRTSAAQPAPTPDATIASVIAAILAPP
jgi:3-hydroxyisobutyrate dehydrogenase-like beta-hydroxyacid dehydrogenase